MAPAATTQELARAIHAGAVERRGEGRLEIEDWKVEIANSSGSHQPTEPRPSTMGGPGGPSESAISNLPSPGKLEPVGGAVPLGSPFSVVREPDRQFAEAIARGDSIVLVKGPRQVGKTPLLARGLQEAREGDARVALTDFQKLAAEQLASTETLFFTLA